MSIILSKQGKSFDWITFTIYLALMITGWLMIYSATSTPDSSWIPSLTTLYGKQFIWMTVGLSSVLAILLVPFAFWRNFSFLIYFSALILLVAVLVFGKEIKGAQSWFSMGIFTLQPSEFAKLGTALAVAAYTASTNFKISNSRALLTGIALFVVPILLILLQPDAGSALVFTSFFILFYRLGLWNGYFILFFSAVGLFIASMIYGPLLVTAALSLIACAVLFYNLKLSSTLYLILFIASILTADVITTLYDRPIWMLAINGIVFVVMCLLTVLNKKFQLIGIITPLVIVGVLFAYSSNFLVNNMLPSHQRDRIQVWLQPSKADPRGSLYNVIQSKVAIGSGGLTGKGFAEGSMTKLNYVPEQSTDFIFCTIGEEQGFLGVFAILILYAVFIGRIFIISEQSRRPFIRNYGYILGGILLIHYFVNIGMTMGLVLIIGIPLPFLSYGGSSLIFFSMMVGIYLRLQLDDSSR